MGANIYGFAERNGNAWWGRDKRLEGHDSKATTAVTVAGIGFPVTTEVLYYRRDGVEYASDNVAIIRPGLRDDESRWVQLGVASPQYTPISNYRVAEMLDPLTERWPVETVGALGKGEDFFITLDAGTAEIAGDEMKQWYFVWNKHDGSGALRIMFTPVRVVCQNTCIMGARAANVTASVIHTPSVEAEAKFAMDLVVQLQAAQANSMSELAQFPKLRLTNDQIKDILREVYPDRAADSRETLLSEVESGSVTVPEAQLGKLLGAKASAEAARAKAAKQRLAVYQEFVKFNDDHFGSEYTRSGWALYNAVTQLESHGKPGPNLTRSLMLGGERGKIIQAAYVAIAKLIPVELGGRVAVR